MTRIVTNTALFLVALAPATVRAGTCDGSPGWFLDMPTTVEIGTTVTINLNGPANEMALVMVSLGAGPTDLGKYGLVCVDFPLYADAMFTLDSTGFATLQAEVDCDPDLIGLVFYSQFITCNPQRGVSNMVMTTLVDGIHVGDVGTGTQEIWGDTCPGSDGGCIREVTFPGAFPSGLVIGDADGPGDADGFFAARWTSSPAIERFLPATGTPALLGGDATNPATLTAGSFAGHLVAAKLNVAFDDIGGLDCIKCRPDIMIGDLVFVAGVVPSLIGWTPRQLIDLSDAAIAGELGSGPFDLDGDTIAETSIADLAGALAAFNANFESFTVNLGYLALP